MFSYHIAYQFIFSLFGLVLWGLIILAIRKKINKDFDSKRKNKPAGFWIRFVALSFDLNLIHFLSVFLCYWGTVKSSNQLYLLFCSFYFFFSWIFCSTTIGNFLLRVTIVTNKDSNRPSILRFLLRFIGFLFLAIGWIPIFFNKNKRALHDLIAGTKVIYAKPAVQRIVNKKVLRFSLLLFMLGILFFATVLVGGLGERFDSYIESSQVKMVDLNNDGLTETIRVDTDNDGKVDVMKVDVDGDKIIDSIMYDTNVDGSMDAVDVDNDGRIDTYDFNGDKIIDKEISGKSLKNWLKIIWVWLLGILFLGTFVLIIKLERHNN